MRTRLEAIRLVVVVLLGVLFAPPTAAQQAGKVPRIGYLGGAPLPANEEPFRQGLRELGWIEGQSLAIEYRWTEGRSDRLPELLAELIRLNVDVIYTPGSNAAALAAKKATSRIPIVFTTPADPVAVGIVPSLSRPGGNITGIGGEGNVLGSKRLELLKEAVPKTTRVGVLWNPANPSHPHALKEDEVAARALGIQLQPHAARNPEDLDRAFVEMKKGRTEALYVRGDVMFRRELGRIVAFAAQSRLPAIYIWSAAVEAGGLMSYGQDRSEVPRRAAVYVDRILKGAKPGDLPVELPTKFVLAINKKTAKALGLTFPPSIILRADRVIE